MLAARGLTVAGSLVMPMLITLDVVGVPEVVAGVEGTALPGVAVGAAGAQPVKEKMRITVKIAVISDSVRFFFEFHNGSLS